MPLFACHGKSVVKRGGCPRSTPYAKEVASMRRILMLLAVAAMILALTAGPVFGAARDPLDFNGPGEASEVLKDKENKAEPTADAGSNCYGQLSSNANKGPGGNPGSLAVPTTFDPDAEGPLPEGPNYTGHAVSTLDPGDISGFQQDFRDLAAGESEVIDPDTGDAIC